MTYAVEKRRVGRRPFTIVEIDLDYCDLNYGVAPCAAAVGVTGSAKCFNTRSTCQDPDNYDPSPKTYRFCTNTPDKPSNLVARPLVESLTITPTRIAIGSGLGERGSVTIRLRDGKHNDRGIDKYVDERAYDPLDQGTFWGRLLARNRYFLGRKVRIKRGYIVKNAAGVPTYDESNFETRLYFLEKSEGPDASGIVTLIAKDVLKLADDERALAPRPSQGRLDAAITAGATSAALKPVGIGSTYAASGKLRINNEVMAFTRTGDALTLTRGQHFTTAAAHALDDAVQECLEFASQRIDQIGATLLTTYAQVPSEYVNTAKWETEALAYNIRLYNALITEPTGVKLLVNELSEVGPASWWWDAVAPEVVFRTLRPAASASVTLDDKKFLKGSLEVKTRFDLRVSEIAIYFGQRDPTEPVDRASNYQTAIYLVGEGAGQHKYNQNRPKVIYSRWLTASARTFAQEVGNAFLQRYDEAPREFGFQLAPKDELEAGDLFNASTVRLQGPDGLPEGVVLEVLEAGNSFDTDRRSYAALEERYIESITNGVRTLTIAADTFDYDLRVEHDKLYAAPTSPVTVICNIEGGVTVGSTDTARSAFDVGLWPVGSTITITNAGRIQGKGGVGGRGGGDGGLGPVHNGDAGTAGGPALYLRFPITLNNADGEIFGGGGGGGGGASGLTTNNAEFPGGGGGGGAGTNLGTGGDPGTTSFGTFAASPGTAGSSEAGGAGGSTGTNQAVDPGAGGAGGAPGQAGAAGQNNEDFGGGSFPASGGAAGAAGKAIDGLSHITFSGTGDIRGPQVN